MSTIHVVDVDAPFVLSGTSMGPRERANERVTPTWNPVSAFGELPSPVQALCAGLATWLLTAAGAAVVVFFREFPGRLIAPMLGFAAGVMTAASFWSLLLPAIDRSADLDWLAWFPAASGFLVGAGFLRLVDTWTPQLAVRRPGMLKQRSLLEDNPKAFMLVSAITIHNIPEGLAVGVAFGALADAGSGSGSLAAAIALAIGIGIQNVPEGVAVAVPLRAAGWSRWRSFWYGQMSAIVEPVAAVAGALAVRMFTPLLPYALGFAAGAMILVVVAELIPESQSDAENRNAATIAVLAGFLVMMILDVSL